MARSKYNGRRPTGALTGTGTVLKGAYRAAQKAYNWAASNPDQFALLHALGQRVYNEARAASGGGPSGKAPSTIAVDVGSLGKRKTHSGSSNTGNDKKRRNRPSSSKRYGMSAGFLKTKRKRRASKFETSGVVSVREYAGTKTQNLLTIIGHATHAHSMTIYQVWFAVLKKFLFAATYPVTTLDTPVGFQQSIDLTNTDKLRIFFKQAPDASLTAEAFTLTDTTTIIQIITWILSASRGWANDMACFVYMEYVPRVPIVVDAGGGSSTTVTRTYYRMDLRQALVEVVAKSSFKYQNRTVTTTGDNDANDVDNVPIYGKSFEGNGTGPIWTAGQIPNSGVNSIFYASRDTGIINAGQQYIKEPPPQTEFRNVKKTGKLHCQPGEIKTSVLYAKEVHYLDAWMHWYWQQLVVTTGRPSVFGSYRLFFVEKLIDCTSTINMVCAFEHNIKQSSICRLKKKNVTIQYSDTIRDINLTVP